MIFLVSFILTLSGTQCFHLIEYKDLYKACKIKQDMERIEEWSKS